MKKEWLEKMIDEGHSQRIMAQLSSCSQPTIRYWLQRHDLETDQMKAIRLRSEALQVGKDTCLIWCPRHKRPTKHIKSPSSTGYRCSKCNYEYVKARRKKVKEILVKESGGRCSNLECGYNKSFAALHFHHLDPTEKEFNISHNSKIVALDKLRVEIKKCILLCANCHAELEAGELDLIQVQQKQKPLTLAPG